jgi:hypothetical protein
MSLSPFEHRLCPEFEVAFCTRLLRAQFEANFPSENKPSASRQQIPKQQFCLRHKDRNATQLSRSSLETPQTNHGTGKNRRTNKSLSPTTLVRDVIHSLGRRPKKRKQSRWPLQRSFHHGHLSTRAAFNAQRSRRKGWSLALRPKVKREPNGNSDGFAYTGVSQ